MIYEFVDKFLMNNLSKEVNKILFNLNKEADLKIFDIGCFKGNFSRQLKKNLEKKAHFFLFDANPNLKINDFNYEKIAFSNSKGKKNFYLNTFFPASGSSLNKIHLKDKLWNFTRKLITLNFGKQFETLKVETCTIDSYCKENNIDKIDILKIDTEGSEIEILEGAKLMLNKTKIIVVEVLDEKKKYHEKISRVNNILEKNYNFKKIFRKNIWSLSTFSNMRAEDIIFIKK